jgi:uncharacterized membrane protein YeiH
VKANSQNLFLTVDLMGTFVFAMEGALAAVAGNLDFLGLMVLSFVTALGGGIIRDLLPKDIPPGSIRDWRYGAVAFAGGAATFFLYEHVLRVPRPVIIVLDAAGLSLFAVAGAAKALAFDINPFIAVLMGCITGAGGGTVRDVLLAQVPIVLRADVYASVALAGAAVTVIGSRYLKMPRSSAMTFGAVCCFALRLISVCEHWNLPKLYMH